MGLPLRGVRAVVLDITGTLQYANGTVIPGAPDAVRALRTMHLDVRCLSNNPAQSADQVAHRLNGLTLPNGFPAGFEFADDEVLTAGTLAVRYLVENYVGQQVLILEQDGEIARQSAAEGVLIDQPERAVAVLLALHKSPSPNMLIEAARLIREHGAHFLATGTDPLWPYEPGCFRYGAGAFVDVVARLSRQKPTVLAKPSVWSAKVLSESLGKDTHGSSILVVGDELSTDIRLGHRLRAQTALVLTGVAQPWQRPVFEASSIRPAVVLDSIADVPSWLDPQ